MGALGAFSLILAVAIVAVACGYLGSLLARRNTRRARGYFAVGFLCGSVASIVLRGRRRGATYLTGRVLPLATSQRRRNLPAKRHRQVGLGMPLGRGSALGAGRVATVAALTRRVSAGMANSLARPPR